MDIGAHCSMPACNQQDFLPFTCDCCSGVFCLEHRTYDTHECRQAGSHDRRVVQCPVCKQLIRWTAAQDVNAVWEDHVRVGSCTREKYYRQQQLKQKKPKKKRCAANGCRELLLASNQFHCNKCAQDVCLKHRFEADHDCESKNQAQRQQWLGGLTSRPSSSVKPKNFQQNAQSVAGLVVKSTKSAVSSVVQTVKAAGNASNASADVCPMCQQRFAYVSQLIAHINRAHPDTADPRRLSASTVPRRTDQVGPSGHEVCPQCRAIFSTVTALIQHAETAHTGAVTTEQNVRDQDKCCMM